MSRETPRTLAARLGFLPLKSQPGSYFKAEKSYFDGSPVGLILTLHRGRQVGTYQFSLVTDGGKTVVHDVGDYFSIDRAIFAVMVLHEKHMLEEGS